MNCFVLFWYDRPSGEEHKASLRKRKTPTKQKKSNCSESIRENKKTNSKIQRAITIRKSILIKNQGCELINLFSNLKS